MIFLFPSSSLAALKLMWTILLLDRK